MELIDRFATALKTSLWPSSRSDGTLFGIELGDRLIKVSRATVENGTRTISVFSRELSSSNKDMLSNALKELVVEYSITGDNAYFLFPGRDVLVKYISLPTINRHEIRQMAKFQILKESSFPAEEIYAGFDILETDAGSGRSNVIISITKKDAVDRFISIITNSGITPKHIVLAPYALKNLIASHRQLKETSLIIDLDADNAELVVVNANGNLVFSRNITIKENFLDELKKTLKFYDYKKSGPRIDRCFLNGNNNIGQDVENALSGIILNIDFIPEADAKLTGMLDLTEAGFLNLLPEHLRKKYDFSIQKKALLASGALLFGIIAVSAAKGAYEYSVKQQYLQDLNAKWKKVDAVTGDLKKSLTRIDAMDQYQKQSQQCLDSFTEAYAGIPSSICLSLYQYDATKGVNIQGSAFSMNDIFATVTSLEKNRNMEKVKLKYASKRRMGETEIIDFQIECSLKPEL